MELSILLARQIFSMALMMMAGFAAARARILPEDAGKTLSSIVMFVLCPCMIFGAFQMDYSHEKLIGLIIGVAAAVLVHILYIPLSLLMAKVTGSDNLDRASMIYSNCGNLIVPLLGAVLGNEYVFYSSGYIAVQTILLWAHGIRMIDTRFKFNIRRILFNPNVIAIGLGLIFFLLPVGLPPILQGTIDKIAAAIAPMSMISIGIIMSKMNLREVFADRNTWLQTSQRLLVFPIVFVLLVWGSRVVSFSPLAGDVLVATVLAAAGPTAVTVSQMAELFGGDAARAGKVNVMSTILCVVSMPVVIYIYQVLCL